MNRYITEPSNVSGVERDIRLIRNAALRQRRRVLRQQKIEAAREWLALNPHLLAAGVVIIVAVAAIIDAGVL